MPQIELSLDILLYVCTSVCKLLTLIYIYIYTRDTVSVWHPYSQGQSLSVNTDADYLVTATKDDLVIGMVFYKRLIIRCISFLQRLHVTISFNGRLVNLSTCHFEPCHTRLLPFCCQFSGCNMYLSEDVFSKLKESCLCTKLTYFMLFCSRSDLPNFSSSLTSDRNLVPLSIYT